MANLLQDHPLVGIDLGIVNHVSMVVANAKSHNQRIEAKWVEQMFTGRSAYNNKGVDSLLEHIQESFGDLLEPLAQTTKKTIDPAAYQIYGSQFVATSEPIITSGSYSQDMLSEKFEKNRKTQRYYHSLANRILSQCHAIAPEKTGAPILVIGKPTFAATLKGHRAAPLKKVIEFLGRHFMVLLVGEYNTSKLCSQCGHRLQSFRRSTRIYSCSTCKTTSNVQLIDLVVNKDRSAALGMLRIFITMVATGSRPTIYQRPQ